MALLSNYLQEEENKKNQQNQQGGFKVAGGIQGGAAGATGTSKVAPGMSGPKTVDQGVKKGSGFTNLQSYLDQNKGEGSRMTGAAVGFETGNIDKQKQGLAEAQNKAISSYDKALATKDFDENMLAGDVSNMTPAQLALFQSSYGNKNLTGFDKAATDKIKEFDIAQQAAERGNMANRASQYGDISNRTSALADVFSQSGKAYNPQGSKAYNPQGRGALLDSFLMGSKGGDVISGAIEEGKKGYESQITAGEKARLAKIGSLKGAQEAENKRVQGKFNEQMGLAGQALKDAQSFNMPELETYESPEFKVTSIADMENMTAQRDKELARVADINKRNIEAFNKTKGEYLSKGASALARENALAKLIGKTGQTVDFNKLLGAMPSQYSVNELDISGFKPFDRSEDNSPTDKVTTTFQQQADDLASGLKQAKPAIKDLLSTDPRRNLEGAKQSGKIATETTKKIDPVTKELERQIKIDQTTAPKTNRTTQDLGKKLSQTIATPKNPTPLVDDTKKVAKKVFGW